MYRVFLGLGSNLGDRLKYLQSALPAMSHLGNIRAVSAVYNAEPYGMDSKHDFLNAAVELETDLAPSELLHKLKRIEQHLGRTSHSHMKDREIDLDILLYARLYYEEHAGHSLEVPHPDLINRRFALTSLNDIAPQLVHPIEGDPISALLDRCEDHRRVERTSLALQSPVN